MIYACGTCGISALSSSFPPFHDWTYLLMAAFVLYNVILIREGGSEVATPFKTICIALVLFVLSAVMFAGIIWPVVVLYALIFFLSRVRAKDKVTRYLSIGLMALFAVSGVWRFSQAKSQGKYWKLSRMQAGGPGQSYFAKAAKERTFTDEELAGFLSSENTNEARNAEKILERRVREIDSPEELAAMEKAVSNAPEVDEYSRLRRELNALKKKFETEESEGD